MLIPKEALWSGLIGKGRKSLIEDRRTDQVAETTGIRATLSSTANEQQRHDFEQEENGSASTDRSERRQTAGSEEPETSRDRRKKQVPVLLDTRSGERRDRPYGRPTIDYEV